MKYRRTEVFRKAFASLPKDMQELATKAFNQFQKDSSHPSLGVKKMVGRPNIWEGRISRKHRFTFAYVSDPKTGERICVFRNIGPHSILDRNP